jgi:hypothetical protein
LKAKVEVQPIGRWQIDVDLLFHGGERTSTQVMAQGDRQAVTPPTAVGGKGSLGCFAVGRR